MPSSCFGTGRPAGCTWRPATLSLAPSRDLQGTAPPPRPRRGRCPRHALVPRGVAGSHAQSSPSLGGRLDSATGTDPHWGLAETRRTPDSAGAPLSRRAGQETSREAAGGEGREGRKEPQPPHPSPTPRAQLRPRCVPGAWVPGSLPESPRLI